MFLFLVDFFTPKKDLKKSQPLCLPFPSRVWRFIVEFQKKASYRWWNCGVFVCPPYKIIGPCQSCWGGCDKAAQGRPVAGGYLSPERASGRAAVWGKPVLFDLAFTESQKQAMDHQASLEMISQPPEHLPFNHCLSSSTTSTSNCSFLLFWFLACNYLSDASMFLHLLPSPSSNHLLPEPFIGLIFI